MLASRTWHTATDPDESKSTAFSRRLAVGVVGLVFIQLVFGAALRHFGSDHALAAHVLWAIVVAFAVGWLVLWFMAHYPRHVMLVRLAQIMGTLLAVQLMLGAFAYLATYMADYMSVFIQWAIPSLHVAVGALLLVTSVLLAMCSFRLLRPSAHLADDVAEGRLVST